MHRLLEILEQEVMVAMALSGARSLAELNRSFLHFGVPPVTAPHVHSAFPLLFRTPEFIAMFEASIAGSLPKPAWLAEPNVLWPPWKLSGDALATAKRGATLARLKQQEDAGIDIVTDGEQSRQHFVHGFLENVEGIDFDKRVEMGIRDNRYKAMVPTVTGPLRLRDRVHATEARIARANTARS